MEVYTSKHEKIVLKNDVFSSGGEGEVRNIVSGASRFKNICVKIYYQKKRTPEQPWKIKYMVSNPPAKVDGTGFLIGCLWTMSLMLAVSFFWGGCLLHFQTASVARDSLIGFCFLKFYYL